MSSYPWLSTDNQTDQKPGYGGQHGFINFNLYALKLRFSGSDSLLALSVFICVRKQSCGGHVQLNTLTPCIDMRYILCLYVILVFEYWQQLC